MNINPKGLVNTTVILGIIVLVGAAGYFIVTQETLSTESKPPSISNPDIKPTTNETNQQTKSPKINSLSPSSGSIGTLVTIKGSGFTATKNVVKFGSDYSGYIDSADGVTLTFKVPAEQDECHPSGNPCYDKPNIPVTPGEYNVFVSNMNGVSNVATFVVTN